MLERATEALERARAARLQARPRPAPVRVRWSPKRIATLDVGGVLGAMLGADLDGDGRPELLAVTDQSLIAYQLSDGRARELARVSFGGAVAARRSRDPVATVALDAAAGEVLAGSSEYAHGLRARWVRGALTQVAELDGLPLCGQTPARLAPGRNYFEEGGAPEAPPERFFGQRCRDVGPLAGGPARLVARLPVEGPLRVELRPACEPGCASERFELPGVGVAFDVGDVDRDGGIDVAYAGAGAPGDPDAVRVVPMRDPKRTLFRRAFSGGVAAVALIDLDGDGADEVLAAVRLPGSPRVDLWRLN